MQHRVKKKSDKLNKNKKRYKVLIKSTDKESVKNLFKSKLMAGARKFYYASVLVD